MTTPTNMNERRPATECESIRAPEPPQGSAPAGSLASPAPAPSATDYELPTDPGVWEREGRWWGFNRYGIAYPIIDGEMLMNSPHRVSDGSLPRGHWKAAAAEGERYDTILTQYAEAQEEIRQLKLDLAEARREVERLETLVGDYKVGHTCNAKRLTKLGNELGLQGSAFVQFGWGQVETALTAAQKRIEELTTALTEQAQ